MRKFCNFAILKFRLDQLKNRKTIGNTFNWKRHSFDRENLGFACCQIEKYIGGHCYPSKDYIEN